MPALRKYCCEENRRRGFLGRIYYDLSDVEKKSVNLIRTGNLKKSFSVEIPSDMVAKIDAIQSTVNDIVADTQDIQSRIDLPICEPINSYETFKDFNENFKENIEKNIEKNIVHPPKKVSALKKQYKHLGPKTTPKDNIS